MAAFLLTPVTFIIIGITVLISFLCFNNREMMVKLRHHPYSEVRGKEWYRLLSSGFVHGSYIHLFINMFVLYEFGRWVEQAYGQLFGSMGSLIFLLMYLLAIAAGDLPTLLKRKNDPGFASIGASGAVSAVLFIYVMIDPWSKMYLYAIIPIYSIIAAVLYLVYSQWASKNQQDNIDHEAHFYGAVFGVVFTSILAPYMLSNFWNRLVTEFPWG